MGKYSNIVKESAAVSAGFGLGIILQLIIGMGIFIAGFYLIKNDKIKNKEKRSIYYYIGIVLIVIGSAVSLSIGSGLSVLIGEI